MTAPALCAESESWRLNDKAYWRGYVGDTGDILTSPARWEKPGWIKASLVIGMTLGLFVYDEDIREWVQENRTDSIDSVASYAKPLGDGRYILPPVLALYLYGHASEDTKARRAAMLSLESAAVTGLFTQALKFSLHRHRPSAGDPYDTFDGPSFSTKNLSFPSGHSSLAWSVLTVVAVEYGEIPLVAPISYGIASLVALSRINDNAHWASDAFFGSAMGYFTARAVINSHDGGKTPNPVVLPSFEAGSAGLRLVYGF